MLTTGAFTARKNCSLKQGRKFMLFKDFVSSRMDALLKAEEQANFKGVKYIDIDVTTEKTHDYLRKLGLAAFTKDVRQFYQNLIDLILLVDMPLNKLFASSKLDLQTLYMTLDIPGTASEEVKSFLFDALHYLHDEDKMFNSLDRAHMACVAWAKNEGLTTEELLNE